jgi:hypothetical protein
MCDACPAPLSLLDVITLIIFGKVKVKLKLSLCLTKHHAVKTYWGSGGLAPRILDLGTRWRLVVSFTRRPLYPRERPLDTYCIGGWVGSRAVLDAVVGRKIYKASHYAVFSSLPIDWMVHTRYKSCILIV